MKKIMDVSLLEKMTYSETKFVSEQSNEEKHEYYSLARISNSDFDYVKLLLENKQIKQKSGKSLDFGRDLHTALLEPHKYENTQNAMQVKRCLETIPAKLQFLLNYCLKEAVHLFECEGVACKAKIDMIDASKSVVFDIKTTSAKNAVEFEKSIHQYNYDRQLAFYLDSLQASEAVIIAVCKTTFEWFFIQLSEEQINAGRTKYKHMLNLIKEHNLFEKIVNLKKSKSL